MSRELPASGQVTALVLVGLMVLAITAGLALAQGMTTPPTVTTTDTVVTPPLPPVNLIDTPTPTPTPTDSEAEPQGDEHTLVVDKEEPLSEADCPDWDYRNLQDAVDAADTGGTVVVCAGEYESTRIETRNLTLQAHGNAVIKGVGQPAVRITAPHVTARGFRVRTTGANHTIEIGGQWTVVRDMTLNLTDDGTDDAPSVGIFVGDGHDHPSSPDPSLGAATGTLIGNNTFNLTAESNAAVIGVWADADRSVIANSSFAGQGNATAITSTGNGTVVRNNTLRYQHPQEDYPAALRDSYPRPAIKVGSTNCIQGCGTPIDNITAPPGQTWASRNLLVDNVIDGAPSSGIRLNTVANHTIVRRNTITDTPAQGILTRANDTLVQRNNVTAVRGQGVRIQTGYDARILENTMQKSGGWGVYLFGVTNATVRRNEIRANNVYIGGGHSLERRSTGQVVNNTLVNDASIIVDRGNGNVGEPIEVEAHRNRILNNSALGIWVYDFNPTDDAWPIFNATNNIWGCGGPSGGLEDPFTNRTANGSGAAISAGDEPGVSNVHFDPFLVRAGCPSHTPTPKQTPTRTLTPTLTATPTPPPTPTPIPPSTPASNAGSGNGTGGTGNGNDGTGLSGESSDSRTGTTTITATAPSTESPMPTETPTPVVEPGFGMNSWLLGGFILVGLLAVRRQRIHASEESDD